MDPLLARLRRSDLGTAGSVSWVPTSCLRERAIGGGEPAAAVGDEPPDRTERHHPPQQTSAWSQQHGPQATSLLIGNRRLYGQRRVKTESRLRHQPALDGLRGLAVAGVVLFHAGWAGATGGFLGVSTFFTLSGFLITSLLLAERERTGRLDLPAFWGRRARRLLPAAIATLLGVSILAASQATPAQLSTLRGDVLGALGYVANWRFILAGRSYGDLFAAPSPVLHFWSLAIEEQLYVLFPLVVLVTARRRLAPLLVALIAGSVALSFALYTPGGSTDAVYYGTFTRAGELLVGALLAVLLLHRSLDDLPRRVRAMVAGDAVVAIIVLLWLWSRTRQDAPWLYPGGLVVHAALGAVVIVGCQVAGPVRAVLSTWPLRALGRISYGVYLYHWPVFVWYHGPLVARLAITLALATTSFVAIEQPVRERRVRVPVALVPAAMCLVAGVVVASTIHAPAPETFDLAASATPVAPEHTAALEPSAPVAAVFGDSTALRTGFGLRGYGWTTGAIDMRDGGATVGCPLVRVGLVDFVSGWSAPDEVCQRWPTRWRALARGLDAAIVQIGPWDVTDRKIDGRTVHIGEPAFDARLVRAIEQAVDVLSSDGAVVVWLTEPHLDFSRGRSGLPASSVAHISERTRIDRLNALLRQVDARRPEMVVVDVLQHLRTLPGGELAPDLRPDGVHLSEDAAIALAPWLASQVTKAVQATTR
jgi:peptidoglycan/LPS O-acetylase OafA/YrhL